MKRIIKGFFYFNIIAILIIIIGELIFPEPITFDITYIGDYTSWFFLLLGINGYLYDKKYFSLFFWKSFIILLALWESSLIFRDDQFFVAESNMNLIFGLLFYSIFVFLEILSLYLYIKSDIWLSKNDN